MPRNTIACVLITLLTCGVIPASPRPTVADQVASLKAGQKIKAELIGGEILKGRMDSATGGQFSMELSGKPSGSSRVVRFDEVRSARCDGPSAGKKWAIFGVIWVAVGIVAKLTV
jgi:hypothetical protein